jgi:hypothetical protein
MGPVPSQRSEFAIATPRAEAGSGASRALSISFISGSHATMHSRLSGIRGLRITGGIRTRKRRFCQFAANA